MRTLASVLALFGSLAVSAEWSDIGYPLADSLPTELRDYLRAAQAHEPYALAAWVNPTISELISMATDTLTLQSSRWKRAAARRASSSSTVRPISSMCSERAPPQAAGETISPGWTRGTFTRAVLSAGTPLTLELRPLSMVTRSW